MKKYKLVSNSLILRYLYLDLITIYTKIVFLRLIFYKIGH